MATYKPTKIEQETSIIFNEEEATADIYTFNKNLQRRLLELCTSRPDEVWEKTDKKSFDGGMFFVVPKEYIKILPPKKLDNKQRGKLIERLNKAKDPENPF